jgi:hypothetical protein
MSDSSIIRIHRTHVPMRDRLRPYKVMIDGERSGSVRDNHTEDFEVAPGEHNVQLKIDWSGSAKVQLNVESGAIALLRASAHESGRSPIRDVFNSAKHRGDWIDLVVE